MENELWKQVYATVTRIASNSTLKRATFNDADIILTYLWAVMHDRPVSWACRAGNWPLYYRRRTLPTPSTLSRRLRRPAVIALIEKIERSFVDHFEPSECRWIDGKPLPIGGCSKDKEATFGYGAGTIARGYKLHAIGDEKQGFVRWVVYPMNCGESKVARELVASLKGPGYLVGDCQYDKNHLYDLAGDNGIQLVAERRCPNAKGLGHCRHSAYRLRSLALLQTPLGQKLTTNRKGIERMFGNLVSFGCGLGPLPYWVRTLARVRLWVTGKMILYQLWRLNHQTKNTG